MKIDVPFEFGQVVYYWSNYATMGSLKIACLRYSKNATPFEWYLGKSDIYGIRVIIDSGNNMSIDYFLNGRHYPSYKVFATEEEAMKNKGR